MGRGIGLVVGTLTVACIAGPAVAQVQAPRSFKRIGERDDLSNGDSRSNGRYIVGSAHDFSATGWANGEICLPCHTPHHANTAYPRLWNHEVTTATYNLHDGTGTAVDDFDVKSRLCLSCHDGTVALDSFGGQAGSVYIGGSALIGTDLTDDHPVGSEAQYPPDPKPSWWDHAFEPESNLPYGFLETWTDPGGTDRMVTSCVSCHDAHNAGGYDAMLVMSNNASALCLTCHIK